MKFGGELRRLRYNQIGAVVPRGRFTWNGQYSNSPVADMLLGFMSNSESQIGAPIANFRDNYYGLYVQDAWKLSPKMTMTLGLRWEAEPPFLTSTMRSSTASRSFQFFDTEASTPMIPGPSNTLRPALP